MGVISLAAKEFKTLLKELPLNPIKLFFTRLKPGGAFADPEKFLVSEFFV